MESRKSNKYFSNIHEKHIAKIFNANVQPNSGATSFKKGDCINKDFLIDCKTVTSEQKTITVEKEWLDKLEKERMSHRRNYKVIAFNFLPEGEDFFIVDLKLMKHFIEFLKNDEENL